MASNRVAIVEYKRFKTPTLRVMSYPRQKEEKARECIRGEISL